MNIFNGVNRPFITTYNWRASWSGSFDPNKDVYLAASAFPAQPAGVLGNATRYDPLVRVFPNVNENVSLSKTRSQTSHCSAAPRLRDLEPC